MMHQYEPLVGSVWKKHEENLKVKVNSLDRKHSLFILTLVSTDGDPCKMPKRVGYEYLWHNFTMERKKCFACGKTRGVQYFSEKWGEPDALALTCNDCKKLTDNNTEAEIVKKAIQKRIEKVVDHELETFRSIFHEKMEYIIRQQMNKFFAGFRHSIKRQLKDM
jgi:hypothetical protein